jgi:hypothetical protein
MNLNDNLVYRRFRLGPLHQRHPSRSRELVRHHNRLHPAPPNAVIRALVDFLSLGPVLRRGFADLRANRQIFVRPLAGRGFMGRVFVAIV